MARNTVVVSITSNIKGLQSGLSQGESALGKFAKVAAVAAAATAAVAVAVGTKAVKSASQLEQAMGGLDAVFKGQAAQMEEWATKASNSLGLAKSEYAELATIIGSQLKNMGVATDQLAGQTDSLIGMGADLAAQFGGSTSDAVSALSSLLRGERDPIERYGVSINEAAVKAKMAEMGLSGLSGEAEKNAKLQATLALLTQQTADATGAFSREANTLAGAQQRAAAGTENLYATLGTSLLPAVTAVTSAYGQLVAKMQESKWFKSLTANLTDLSNRFADFIYDALNGDVDLGTFVKNLVKGLIDMRQSLFDAASKAFPAILDALREYTPRIIDGIVNTVSQIAQMLVENMPTLLDGAVELFTGLVEALTIVLPEIIRGIVELLPIIIDALIEMIPDLLDAAIVVFTALVDALPKILPEIVTAIGDLLPKIIVALIELVPKLIPAAVQLFTAIVTAIPKILPDLLAALIDLIPDIVAGLIALGPDILAAAGEAFGKIVDAIPQQINDILAEIAKLGQKIVDGVRNWWNDMFGSGKYVGEGFAGGLDASRGSVSAAANRLAGAASGGLKAALKIKSPSRVFYEFGEYIDQGLANGILAHAPVVSKAVNRLGNTVEGSFNADLTAGSVRLTATRDSAASVGNRYEITVQTLAPNAEVGRAVVEAIESYERVRTITPAGAPA